MLFCAGPVNGNDSDDTVHERIDFTCPNNGAIAGVRTTMVESLNDRRFSFKCCASKSNKNVHVYIFLPLQIHLTVSGQFLSSNK